MLMPMPVPVPLPPLPRSALVLLWGGLSATATATAAGGGGPAQPDDAPGAPKPYLMRLLVLGDGGPTLPVSPATLILVAVLLLWRVLSRPPAPKVTARHILLEGHGQDVAARLERMRDEIGTDRGRFVAVAQRYSVCPSGRGAGGSLGTFGRGVMDPMFERMAFDAATPLGRAAGPVRTRFGWHLIWIEGRSP